MLKQVTIECDVPDGYEAVAYRLPLSGEEYAGNAGAVLVTDFNFENYRYLIVRPIEPIPQGVFWLDGPLQIEGIRTTKSFINAVGKCLYRDDFDYDKWLPRAAEFPAYIPPQMVPLGPQDQIDWVRHKGATDRCRVNLVNQDGVVIETVGHRSWAQLKTHYDRSNDHGKSWFECSKPAP